MTYHRDQAIQLVRKIGAAKRDKPVRLATGEDTWIYLDVKGVLTDGRRLRCAANALSEHAIQFGLDYEYRITHIGGPTMGADVLSHTMVTLLSGIDRDWKWFSIRDTRKTTHGLGKWIEGAQLDRDSRVILTDDVANSGKSLVESWHRITETGALVVAIMPLVDRSGAAAETLLAAGIHAPYLPLMDYNDLGLLPLKG